MTGSEITDQKHSFMLSSNQIDSLSHPLSDRENLFTSFMRDKSVLWQSECKNFHAT